ncbi:MAG: pantetheine-phosphate adenylyltransferase [gamma proteobacterium symbiont of Bathyaustriella thionipta]|nr:pantetheine-phosphate adenylyltransferase [gamma proteobacterium symbiont of Bathyaustriella thionipta]
MACVVYPGTFDPITCGHRDLVQRATSLFDKVIVAVAESPSKQPVFTIQERLEMAAQALADIAHVEVKSFDCLLVEFARQHNSWAILRGLRAVSDFDYEFQLAGMNRRLAADIETLFLTPADQFAYISSSLVREVAALGGDVSAFVHPAVEKALQDKID